MTAVAITGAARGNVAGALFNATLSSLLGVFLTPLWVAYFLKTSGQHQPLAPVMLDLIKWLILPLVAGQLSRPLFAAWATRHKTRINSADRATILVLVYTSFCDSFKQGVWSQHGWTMLIAIVGGATILFTIAMTIMGLTSSALGFSREDRIAAMFCGSKKTLASGVPMARLIFGSHPAIGVILLPIMIYHPLQLVICGVLAQRWGNDPEIDSHP